jgi:predicted secreted protein with PEFG-CTERM motif
MIVLFTVAILSVSALSNNAYANHIAGSGSTLDVVAAEGSDTINVSGTTDRSDEIIIKVLAPNRNLVSVDQITPSGGSYSATIKTSHLWNQDGEYTITIQQSQGAKQFEGNNYNHLVRVEVTSGTTSATSISIDARVVHDEEFYYLDQNAPITPSLKKLTITASGVEGSTTINVSGTTDRSDTIIIKVTAPNGNLVSIDQITPTGGSYAATVEVGGPLWSQDGMYTIKARQGPTGLGTSAQAHGVGFKSADDENTGWLAYQASAEVEIVDGHVIPEFGVIAAMILAVAIVSIIVVTAKTRLSLVPRY